MLRGKLEEINFMLYKSRSTNTHFSPVASIDKRPSVVDKMEKQQNFYFREVLTPLYKPFPRVHDSA